jgi:hypothetical protein
MESQICFTIGHRLQAPELWSVECGGMKASMDRSRYVSGSKGACIQYEGQWVTPNNFERLAGGVQ